MKKNNKGFTLAELLIVVAIIAVLVAISIPIFTSQLEKAREATDAANIRSAYAEVMAAALTEADAGEIAGVTVTNPGTINATYTATVDAKQTQAEWQSTNIEDIGGLPCGNAAGEIAAVTDGSSWTITYTTSTGEIAITPVNS